MRRLLDHVAPQRTTATHPGDQQPLSPAAAEDKDIMPEEEHNNRKPPATLERNAYRDNIVYRAAAILSIALAAAIGLRTLLLHEKSDVVDSLQQQSCRVVPTGASDDTAALQQALDSPLCAEILLLSDRTYSVTELRVRRDNVALTIEPNATLAGMPSAFRALRPDCAAEGGLEFRWRDWCALLHVTSASNFTLRGAGVIAPGGVGGKAPDFYSALHIRSTVRVRLLGVRVTCTAWWWCTVMHNASDIAITNVFIDGSAGRDGLDLVNCRHVLIENSVIEGSDDALCFKTIKNDGLAAWPAAHVLVRNVTLGSTWCNAVQFGSATEVDMSDFRFFDLRIVRFARKAAISMVSMDGADIRDVRFERVRILGRDIASPIFLKIGHRADCEDGKGTCGRPGSIGAVSFANVSALSWGNVHRPKPGHARAYTATIEGLNASHRIGPLSFTNLTLVAPGGGTAADATVDPPHSPLSYQPRYDGVRPSYGLFVRYAKDVALTDCSLGIASGDRDVSDGRPAIVADDVEGLTLRRVRVTDGRAPCQLQTRNSSGDWADGGQMPACAWSPAPARREEDEARVRSGNN